MKGINLSGLLFRWLILTVWSVAPQFPHVERAGRVVELMHGEHFDDILRDTPDEMRPPGLIAFYGSRTCGDKYDQIHFEHFAETQLPSRERLFIGKYDFDIAPIRSWIKFTPERDLASRLKIPLTRTSCPVLAFIPRTCDGETEWCVNPNGIVGCESYKESCPNPIIYDGNGNWLSWARKLIEKEGEPKISPILKTYLEQGKWIRSRDYITSKTHFRNHYIPPQIPNFTETGVKVVDCPEELCAALLKCYKTYQNRKKIEHWPSSGTQNSASETKMHFVSLSYDSNIYKLAQKELFPLMKEWANAPLELTSFYGMREYHPNHFLRPHIDRIDQLVISATIVVDKIPLNEEDDVNSGVGGDPWPLEIVNFNGENIRIPHCKNKVIFYESAKVIHGRPSRNPVGLHVGAFLHFKPKADATGEGWERGWGSLVTRTRAKLDELAHEIEYVTTPTIEPSNPVYTEIPYTEGTKLEGDSFLWPAKISPLPDMVKHEL